MSIIDQLLSVIAPHHCVSCGVEGLLLCQGCAGSIVSVPSRCYRCHKLTNNYRTCISCRSSSLLFSVTAAKPYESYAKTLVTSLKFNGAQAAAKEMAHAMVGAWMRIDGIVVVPVPTTTDRIRYRGFDQAILLARSISKQSDTVYLQILGRQGRKHQVGASRHVRLQQLKNAFYVNKPHLIKGQHVLLIDDVCTTGATLEAAAKALHDAGAARISALVYAQA